MVHDHDPATCDVIRSSGLAGAIPASPPHVHPHSVMAVLFPWFGVLPHFI